MQTTSIGTSKYSSWVLGLIRFSDFTAFFRFLWLPKNTGEMALGCLAIFSGRDFDEFVFEMIWCESLVIGKELIWNGLFVNESFFVMEI